MKLDKSRFAAVVAMFASHGPDIEIEAIHEHVPKETATRLLQYLKEHVGGLKQTESLDVVFEDGVRITIDGTAPSRAAVESGKWTGASAMSKERVKPSVSFPEYRLRINMKSEIALDENNLLRVHGSGAKRTYRLKRRFSSSTSDGHFRIDVTAIRQLENIRDPLTNFNRLLRIPEAYEVEVEYTPGAAVRATADELARSLFKHFSVLLKVINDTDVLLTPAEQRKILVEFASVMDPNINIPSNHDMEISARTVYRLFAAPKPVTLDPRNLLLPPLPGDVSVRQNYTVTYKADGERTLLFVDSASAVFTIDNRLNIRNTGLTAGNGVTHCVLDGEHVANYRTGIPTFMCFDAYVALGKDVRQTPLMDPSVDSKKRSMRKNRAAVEASIAVDRIKVARSVVESIKSSDSYAIIVKEFLRVDDGDDLFKQCKDMFRKWDVGSLPYDVDGLVFTPMLLPATAPNTVFKWKPPNLSTIDFLVHLKPATEDVRITGASAKAYRVAELLVGFRPSEHAPITSMQFLTEDRPPEHQYVDKPFEVLHPGPGSPAASALAFLVVADDGIPRCANGEEIVDKSVVEFAYDMTDLTVRGEHRWQPLRLRRDKDRGNDYAKGAMTTWQTILHPIEQRMLAGDVPLPTADEVEQQAHAEGVYYAKHVNPKDGDIAGMRAFHRDVKGGLLMRFKGHVKSLFDFGCGKAGDLHKWIAMGLGRVMGVDVNIDNLTNPYNGAHSRVIDAKKKRMHVPRMAFVVMNAMEPMGAAQIERIDDSNGDRQVAKVLYGMVDQSSISNPKLRAYHRFALGGFDVATCMFAIHYFFESKDSFHTFAKNVGSVLKSGGIFVGCCLDGNRVDELLRAVNQGEAEEGRSDDGERVMWRITKMYSQFDKVNMDSNWNLPVKVFVESIGQTLTESLVDFRCLVDGMGAHGMRPLNNDECKRFGWTESTGFFQDQWDSTKYAMSPQECRYSFLNRWFAFVKE